MEENRLRIKKEVSISHIITFFVVLGSLILWYSGVESRIAIAETKLTTLESNALKREYSLNRIEDKLDGLIMAIMEKVNK